MADYLTAKTGHFSTERKARTWAEIPLATLVNPQTLAFLAEQLGPEGNDRD